MIDEIKKTKVRHLNIPLDKRIIFVSDIHGDLDTFKKGLEDLNYTDDDYLFLIGDIFEKGDLGYCLKTLEYVIDMTKKYKNFYPMAGNCDEVFRFIIPDDEIDKLSFYLNVKKHSILNDIALRENLEVSNDMDLIKFKKIIFDKYKYLVDFTDSLDDVIFINDKLVLVHAGLDDINNIPDKALGLLKYDNFYKLSKPQEKIMIVGHYPTRNYRTDIFCCNPILDYDKKIFSIDGGNHVSKGGQINFLILDNLKDMKFSFKAYDHYPKYIVKQDIKYQNQKNKLSINYDDNEVDIIAEDLDYYLVRHKKTNVELWCHKSSIYMADDYKYYAYDSTNLFMSLNKGDLISIIIKANPYSVIKHDGYVGMIETKYIEDEN